MSGCRTIKLVPSSFQWTSCPTFDVLSNFWILTPNNTYIIPNNTYIIPNNTYIIPQYLALNALTERYANKPFKILGFPCNQFLRQVREIDLQKCR